jgi:CheY-like chemotaxis protein
LTEVSTKAIVCVDDEAIILMSLKAQLRNYYKDKFIIETTTSAEEAILVIEDLVQNNVKVLILISDWNMPTMKGDELFHIIRKKYPDINFLLITGQADKTTLDSLRNSIQLVGILNKPWDQKILQHHIDSINL